MLVTRMPRGRSSSRMAWVKPIKPNFAAEYADQLGKPERPAMDDNATISPPSASNGAAYLQHKNVPVRLTRNVCSQSASDNCSNGAIRATPAAHTSTSIWPLPVSEAMSIKRSTSFSSPTSHGTTTAWPPAWVISSANECSSAAVRAASTTVAPCWAKSRAVARPIPRPAPVMTTVLVIAAAAGNIAHKLGANLRIGFEYALQ